MLQQIQHLPVPVWLADDDGGHLLEPDTAVLGQDFFQKIVQLVLVPDVVFLHQLRMVPEELQGGDFQILILLQIQGLQQRGEVPFGNRVVAKALAQIPQHVAAGKELVFI